MADGRYPDMTAVDILNCDSAGDITGTVRMPIGVYYIGMHVFTTGRIRAALRLVRPGCSVKCGPLIGL